MKAEILSVGTELLLGDIVNTDAQFLARELARLGFTVLYHSTVGDNEERLSDLLQTALSPVSYTHLTLPTICSV